MSPYTTWMPYASRVGASCDPITSLRSYRSNVNQNSRQMSDFWPPSKSNRDGHGNGAFFANLAQTAKMGAGPDGDVCAVQASQFRHTQPRLDAEHQQGMISPAFPARPIRGSEQSIRLDCGEVSDGASVEAGMSLKRYFRPDTRSVSSAGKRISGLNRLTNIAESRAYEKGWMIVIATTMTVNSTD